AAIASTELRLLLRDEVFVDFFNVFLNLPVFGQTPIYISSTGQWELCPELPSHLDPSPAALLAWLEKHRLPPFCKSSLCLHLVLCQKLLGFVRSGEAAELLNWQSADQWLLEKCISGSQGMWHFRAFIQGTAAEELTNFWLTTERLLELDESDARQRDLYLSLLHKLKATHLREGSSVTTLCRTIMGSLLKAGLVQPISTRREILSKMQERVLFTIQSYWLPKFFIHCRMSMEKEQSCQPLLREYRERLLCSNWQEPSGFPEDLFTMHVRRSQGLSGPYCSKKAKADIWDLVKEERDFRERKMPTFRVQPERQPGPAGSTGESQLDENALGAVPQQPEHPASTAPTKSAACGDKGGATSPNGPEPGAEWVLHLKGLHEERILSNLRSSARLVQLPSPRKSAKTLSFLPWALRADSCAGRPFRHFLKGQHCYLETLLLDLWHDLEEFLPVVLDPSKESSFFLRHLIGERICKTYLEESTAGHLPLGTRTVRSLQKHLMYGEFSPCIFRAQREICKVLCCFYEEFLAADDRTFLQFMSLQSSVPVPEEQGHALGKDEHFLLFQRLNGSLKLSQALHGTRNLEGLSSEHWQLLATQDLRKGGFLQAELELLCRTGKRQLCLSARAHTDKAHILHLCWPLALVCQPCSIPTATEPEKSKRRTVPVREPAPVPVEKPSTRPRHFVKVLHNLAHLQYFRQFLEERGADKPLHFWMAVEKLVRETSPERKRLLLSSIIKNYFHGEIPA
ncbi:RGSL protein, partial [Tricholaema leucomelas]|nr:RGSL protein [Tricholaema leucomelas]